MDESICETDNILSLYVMKMFRWCFVTEDNMID